jgi:rRNA maturation protein Nop10
VNRKKIAIAVLLIAAIAVAVAVTVKRVRSELKAQPPTLQVDQKFPKIDIKSLEVFWETTSDWATQYAPDVSGRYKNPATGEQTMVDVMKCASCGQLIPVPQPSPAATARQQKREVTIHSAAEAREALLRDYICPRCGKHAWIPPPLKPSKSEKSE